MRISLHPEQRLALALPAAGLRGRDRVTNVALVLLCQVCHGLTLVGVPLFLPLIREDLQITFTQAGALAVAATLSYALGQVPAGYLADRYGPGRLFGIGLIGWSVLSAALGLIDSFWLALLDQFVAGAFRALLFAPGLTLLASWFPPERRATAMSLFMVGGFSGNILLSLTGPLLASHYGWRAAFIFYAVLGVGAALAFLAFTRETPRKAPTRQLAIAEALRLFRHRILWICGALQFIRFSAVTGFIFWLPSFLVADRGLSLQAAGLVAAMSAAFSVSSNALGGYVSDRLSNPPLVIGSSLAVLACATALLVRVDSTPMLLLVIAAGSISLQFYFGPLFLVPMEVLGQRAAGTATGIGNLFANVGGLATAYALGYIKDHTGSFTWGFTGISVMCLVGAVLSVVLARMRKRALALRE